MFYKNILFLCIFVFLVNCSSNNILKNTPSTFNINPYSNKGFALVYSDDLYKQNIIGKKIDERSLIIFQKNLKTNTPIKITNILNNKSLIAVVGKDSKYPSFNNAVISMRIFKELDLNIEQPYLYY